MQEPTMLYRCPGPESFEGVSCETTVVESSEVAGKLAEGWHRDWIAAGTAHQGDAAKLAANEAEQAEIARKLQEAAPKGRGKRAA